MEVEIAHGIRAFPHLEFPREYSYDELEAIAHTMKEKLDLEEMYIYWKNTFVFEVNNKPIVVLRFSDQYYYLLYSKEGKSYGSPFWRVFSPNILPLGYSPIFFKIEKYLLETLEGKKIQIKLENRKN